MTERDKVIAPLAGETKAGGVLVHCQAGMSRSATVVAAHLIQTLELDPMDAVEMIKEHRPVVEYVLQTLFSCSCWKLIED